MKKTLLSAAIILLIGSTFAQNWCPPGAKWHFKRGGSIGDFSNCDLDMVYSGDTTVSGTPCKKLDATLFGQIQYLYGYNSPVTTQHFQTYITYENNGVLFLYNNTRAAFDTVVNFKANIGDKWLRPGDDPQPNGCTSRWAFTVIDTTHVIINGFSLKKITVTNPSAANSAFTYTNVFLERVFFTGGYLNYDLFPTNCELYSAPTDIPGTFFRCYEDNIFPTYNTTNGSCKDFFTGIAPVTAKNSGFVIYPNPNNGSFEMDLQQPTDIRIINMLGETVYATNFKESGKVVVEAQNIAPGAYVLKAKTAEGYGQMKFIRQ